MTSMGIIFTDQAAAKVWQLIDEEENHQLKLRVFVTGGGCSGFQYGFSFDEVAQADDMVIQKTVKISHQEDQLKEATVCLLIDPLSYQYLMGAEIDYKEDLEGEQFIIRNPNATTTCGCGSSFTVD